MGKTSRSQPSSRTFLLVGAALIVLAATSFLRPDLYSWHWNNPIQFESHHSEDRFALHPEDHVYRQPSTRYLDWYITSGFRRPDGVLKEIYLINDLFLGPTVEARPGDTLIIKVTNGLSEEPLAIHWHGLHVANSVDGAAGVSQCPITPGAEFTYNITIPEDQAGTFWYHAHAGVARADGLYGGIVIHSPASTFTVRGLLPRSYDERIRCNYEKELLLLIGDWYHRPAKDVLAWYKTPGNFGNEPVPDSLLINGAGNFECSMAVPARPVDCVKQHLDSYTMNLDPGTTYRVRVVNTGSLAGFNLVFDKEQLDLIHVDSVEVEPLQQPLINSVGILYPGQRMDFILHPCAVLGIRCPGQRMDFILHPSGDHKDSALMVQLDQECFKYPNPALTPDQTFPIRYTPSNSSPISNPIPEIHNKIDLSKTPSSKSALQNLPPKANQTHVVYTKIQKMARNHNSPFGYFNQTSWRPQQDPLIPLSALAMANWDENQFGISTGPDPVWVDLVVNNLDEGPHPFHLHGHHFYIMTIQEPFGWGSYNPFEDSVPPGLESESMDGNPFHPYELSRIALRDTVQIPSRGYAVLRFRADNPGVWLFHCHILWHLATGMAMVVDVGSSGDGFVHDASLQGCPS